MKYLTVLLVASVMAGVLGCDTVTLDGPIGEPLPKAEATQFVGRWTDTESEVVEFRLTDIGTLTAGTLKWDEELQKHVAKNHKFDARSVGDSIYFLFTDDEQSFAFVRIKRTGKSEFKMYAPDAKAFRSAVEDGRLEGKITVKRNDHFNVHLRAGSARTKEVLSAESIEDWYDGELTQTFHCIKRFDATE